MHNGVNTVKHIQQFHSNPFNYCDGHKNTLHHH